MPGDDGSPASYWKQRNTLSAITYNIPPTRRKAQWYLEQNSPS